MSYPILRDPVVHSRQLLYLEGNRQGDSGEPIVPVIYKVRGDHERGPSTGQGSGDQSCAKVL